MKMPDLKPCPFCGGEAIVEIGTKSKIVFCTRCKARTNRFAEYNEEKNAEKAVEAWNRRREIKEFFCEITIDGEEILRKALDKMELDGKTLAEWLELLKGYKQLETNYGQVSKALCGTENATLEELLQVADQVRLRTFSMPCFRGSGKTLALQLSQRINELEAELAAVKRERDAALASIGEYRFCGDCKHIDVSKADEPCRTCLDDETASKGRWEWRGICPENTEVQNNE